MNALLGPQGGTSPISTDSARPSIGEGAEALRACMAAVDADLRLDGRIARRAVVILRALPASDRGDLFRQPDKFLGAFESLPSNAQRAILAAIQEQEAWRLRGYSLGPVHTGLVRVLFEGRLRIQTMLPKSNIVQQGTDALAFGARRAPADLLSAMAIRWSGWSGRRASRPSFGAFLTAAGLDSRLLAACYARPIEQRPGCRGYWYDSEVRLAYGLAVGIDFLQTQSGYVFVENNGTFGQHADRAALYEHDPFVENMLDCAAEGGFRRLVIVDGNSEGIDPATAQRYESGASRRNIELTLVDRENVAGSRFLRSYLVPDISTTDTLVIRTKAYPTALDFVVDEKGATHGALSKYLAGHPDPDLLLPPSTAQPELGQVDADDPFPNLVYKMPELDQGRGVIMLKARSVEHARELIRGRVHAAAGSLQARLQQQVKGIGAGGGFFQPYIKPVVTAEGSLFKVRAHVLITPQGVKFLSAHRTNSARRLPASLPFGIVEDVGPFLVNHANGGFYTRVPDDQLSAVERAALAVGRGLAWAFEYGFHTRPA